MQKPHTNENKGDADSNIKNFSIEKLNIIFIPYKNKNNIKKRSTEQCCVNIT